MTKLEAVTERLRAAAEARRAAETKRRETCNRGLRRRQELRKTRKAALDLLRRAYGKRAVWKYLTSEAATRRALLRSARLKLAGRMPPPPDLR
jgi:hypothetical protein